MAFFQLNIDSYIFSLAISYYKPTVFYCINSSRQMERFGKSFDYPGMYYTYIFLHWGSFEKRAFTPSVFMFPEVVSFAIRLRQGR